MRRSTTEQIDGWKSIAAYLGRDRSTVIRWARDRALPVHAVPGGKSRTVYAHRHELDAWLRGHTLEEIGASRGYAPELGTGLRIDLSAIVVEHEDVPQIGRSALAEAVSTSAQQVQVVLTGGHVDPGAGATHDSVKSSRMSPARDHLRNEAPEQPGADRRDNHVDAAGELDTSYDFRHDTQRGFTAFSIKRWRCLVAPAACGVLLVAVATIGSFASTGAFSRGEGLTFVTLEGPTKARFIQARDDVAMRSQEHLSAALVTLGDLSGRYPDHAAIHEALAEAWLLAREYGSAPDALAFARARSAANAARALDPRSVVADRVEGVTAYWWDRDPARAGRAFRRAIANGPRDALAHLWYANILTDNGEDAAAGREFTAARMIAPGAPYLLVDHAWGLWSAGQDAEALAQLTALGRRSDLASVPDCLSVVALAQGDVSGYARELAKRAKRRGSSELTAYSRAVVEALALGGERGRAAAYAIILSRALSLAENTAHPDHSWPAFIASAMGDRAQLRGILNDARAWGEHWGAAGFVRRIRARWRDDVQVLRALDVLAQPAVEISHNASVNDPLTHIATNLDDLRRASAGETT